MNETMKNRKDERKTLRYLLVFFFLALLTAALGVFCLRNVNRIIVPVLFGAGNIVLYAFCVYAILIEKQTLIKSLLSLYILLFFILGIYTLLERTGFFEVIQSKENLQEYLQKTGVWMPVLYTLLQFLQVIILPIPSVLSTIVGVALFGAFWAMAYSLLGILLGSLVAFLIGRRLGERAVAWIVGEETLKKWKKKVRGKDNVFLTLMFVLPVFPDDVLCFVAGLSNMSLKYFLTVIFFSRFIGIAATCYSINLIPFNTWWGITVWVLFAVIVTFAFIYAYKNMERIQKFFRNKKVKRRKNFSRKHL